MGSDQLARAVIDGDEQIGAALTGHDRLDHVASTHLIYTVGHDLPMRNLRPCGR
jgi:hypothetical protein